MSITLVQVVVSGLLLGAVYALFSSGLTLIWGMMNVVNFAHGDFVMLGMYTAVVVWTALGGGPWVGLIVTLGLHFLLTRTAIGSRMLAVSEDAVAAQLMGIRPQRMQALAWALAGGATGIAGALIATFFYTSPTVGETLAIVAFVTVSLGGFGSVTGALVAGLLIGVVESLSAFLIGPVYKDVIVYVMFVLVLWFRPQGLMGKA